MTMYSPRNALVIGAAFLPLCAMASSHREAPAIAGMPQLDGTDFYMFRSYEPGRNGYITMIANYLPLQDPGGGPNFFNLSTDAVYSIHLDTNGDAMDDVRFDIRISNAFKDLTVDSGGKQVPVPLLNTGQIGLMGTNQNVVQSYTVEVTQNGKSGFAQNVTFGGTSFTKPVDNIGNKTIPDYEGYASHFVHMMSIPGCATNAKVFVGQRKEGFVVNIGEVFDLVNLNPAGPRDAEPNALFDKNVTSIAIEVPISCVVNKSDPVIGGYTTAAIVTPATGGGSGTIMQVSRLGMPLVNELVIGLPDKDKFNASVPSNDAQFLTYVTNPTIPVILHNLFGSAALIPGEPRNDLVAAFLTGVKGLNQPVKVTPSEMLRLNTSTPPTVPASQNDLGVLGGDNAGYPNGRRPYDDVVDITLRVAEGALCGAIGTCGTETTDPNKGAPYTDESEAAGVDAAHSHVTGAIKPTDTYLTTFPYLNTPIPGSPNSANGLTGF